MEASQKHPVGEQGGWMLQIIICGIFNTGLYLIIYLLPLLFSLHNPAHKWDNYMRLPNISAELLKSANILLNAVTEEWNFPQYATPTCRKRSIVVHLTKTPEQLPVGCWSSTSSPLACRHTSHARCLNWMLKVHHHFCWWLALLQNPNNLGITIWDLSLISCEQDASPLCAFVSLPAPSALLN